MRRVRKSIAGVTGVHGFFSGKGRREEDSDRMYGGSFSAFSETPVSAELGGSNPLFRRRASEESAPTKEHDAESQQVRRASEKNRSSAHSVLHGQQKDGAAEAAAEARRLYLEEVKASCEPALEYPSVKSSTLQSVLSGAPKKQRRRTFSDAHWANQSGEINHCVGTTEEGANPQGKKGADVKGGEGADDKGEDAAGAKGDRDDAQPIRKDTKAVVEKCHKERQLENYMKQFQQTKQEFLPHGSVEIAKLDEDISNGYKAAVADALKFVVELYPRHSMHAADDESQAIEQIELGRLFARLQGWYVQPGDWVIQKGMLCDRFVIIAGGSFTTTNEESLEIGTYFNETSLILPTMALHSVKAETDGVVFTLLRKDLVDFIRLDVEKAENQVRRIQSSSTGFRGRRVRASSVMGWQTAGKQKLLRRASSTLSKVRFSHLDFSKSKDAESVSFLDFREIKVIGKGTFGKVKLVENVKDGKRLAMKVYKKALMSEYGQKEHVQEESRLMSLIDNPFFAKIEVCWQDRQNLYLIMELVSGGELTDLIYHEDSPFHVDKGGFPEEAVRFYAANIVCMLEHLQNFHSIVYRDLKPENVILSSNGYLKLVDFGFARKLPHVDAITGKSSHECYDQCCSPNYVAPEVVKKSGHGFPVDWWSFGVLLYEMASGSLPFDYNNDIILFRKIKEGTYKWNSNFNGNEDEDPYLNLRDIVKRLLDIDPVARSQFVVNVKEHAWFQMDPNFDWAEIENGQAKPPHIPVPFVNKENDPEADDELDMGDYGECDSEVDWWPEGFQRT